MLRQISGKRCNVTQAVNQICDQSLRFSQCHNFYAVRRSEYATTDNLSFRVSPIPLKLNQSEYEDIKSMGGQ